MLFLCKFSFYFYSAFRVLERFEDMLFLSLVPGWAISVWRGRQDGGGQAGASGDKRPAAILPPLPKISPSPQATNKIALKNGLTGAMGRARQGQRAKSLVPRLGSPPSATPQCPACGSPLT